MTPPCVVVTNKEKQTNKTINNNDGDREEQCLKMNDGWEGRRDNGKERIVYDSATSSVRELVSEASVGESVDFVSEGVTRGPAFDEDVADVGVGVDDPLSVSVEDELFSDGVDTDTGVPNFELYSFSIC